MANQRNGELLTQAREILESGEVPQSVSNKLIAGMLHHIDQRSMGNSDAIHGTPEKERKDGLVYRIGQLEEKEKNRKDKQKENKKNYLQPAISAFIALVTSALFAWILGLLN